MSDAPLFNEHWYRVKDLKPRLTSDLEVHRHVYRGVGCYVLHRRSTGSYHRVDDYAFQLVGQLDGSVSIAELWDRAIQAQDSQAPTQSEFMGLLAQLHEAELLTINRKLNAERMFNRGDERARADGRQRYLNPLYMRFRLFDPDALLTKLAPLTNYLLRPTSFVLWAALLVLALIELAPNWAKLQYELSGVEFFAPQNIGLFFVIYPLLKLIHEFSHGMAVKRFGGEVHELGIAMMVLLPIPYVDASAAAVFPEKRQRMLVGAIGVLSELGVAAVATLVWSATAAGPVHDAALLLMLIGGLSTLLFNGNPLLKFDGYYVLADYVEIPGLADRSKQYLLGLSRARLFGMKDDVPSTHDSGERFWLFAYGLLSSCYRIGLMLTIAYMLSSQFFFFGVALALWVMATLILLPAWRFLRFLAQQQGSARLRATAISGGLLSLLLTALFWVPVPLNTVANGIVWLPENAIVRPASDCEVTQVMVAPGSYVEAGASLFRCADPALQTRMHVLDAQLDEVRAQRSGLEVTDRVQRELLRNQIDTLSKQFNRAQQLVARQLVTAETAGQLVQANELEVLGQFLQQGEAVAYIVPSDLRTIRVAVEQSDAQALDEAITAVELRFAEQAGLDRTYISAVQRQTPKASYRVASPALTSLGGGPLAADPEGDGSVVREAVFDLELAWPSQAPLLNVGSHVSVKFRHEPRPLMQRLVTQINRMFLGRLNA
ncbi:MAG: HlyD family efflux transporter periplasmic adaptor subunit [Pseudomonadales bacterium]